MLTLYQDQYPMFGHAQLMPLKVTWDYAWYWGVLCQFFFQRRLTDSALFLRLKRAAAGLRNTQPRDAAAAAPRRRHGDRHNRRA
jgi:hypothetical protein